MRADTHFGPIDRAGWSARVAEAANALDADVAVYAGDIADCPSTRSRFRTSLGASTSASWR